MFVARVPVKGYDNYLIYEDGRLWSNFTNKFLKQTNNGNGYYIYELTKDKIGKLFTVHNLVGNHFLPPKPTEKHTIDHIDRIKKNNHISNLRWATPSEQGINRKLADSKSGHIGIRITQYNKFRAIVSRNNINYSVGTYATLEEAILERDNYIRNFNEG